MYDLILVGSSFASTFFLKKYLERNNLNKKVLVLERGHFYPTQERINDRRNAYHNLEAANPNPEAQETFVNLTPEKPWHFSVGFGGSSNCWFGCTPRFLPNDFKMKSLYGVAMDWPLGYAELEPYYEEVELLMDISRNYTFSKEALLSATVSFIYRNR